MKNPLATYLSLLYLAIVAILDLGLTIHYINLEMCVEQNPIAIWFLNRWGCLGLIGLKTIGTLLTGSTFIILAQKSPGSLANRLSLIAAGLIQTALLAYWAYQLTKVMV